MSVSAFVHLLMINWVITLSKWLVISTTTHSRSRRQHLHLSLGVIREIKAPRIFSRERQRGSRDLTFPAFAVCRPPFLLEEDIFPVWRERENVSICSPFLLSISPF